MLQFHWLMTVYITPEKLNKFNMQIPGLCNRCGEDRGTLFHCIWSCPKIKEIWEEFRAIIQEILSIRLVMEPKYFLLGLYPIGHNINHSEEIFINMGILQAKRVIALTWKNIGKSIT